MVIHNEFVEEHYTFDAKKDCYLKFLPMKNLKLFFVTLFIASFTNAQVGVNTTTIDPSAALDIQYGTTPKGLLTPRMTTVQRTGITAPADGLIVYDTDLKSFFHYKPAPNPGWIRLNSDVSGRVNFRRIKSMSDLAAEKLAGNNTKYLLNTNYYYEINGNVVFDLPIDLNNAYLVGLDANEDKISRSGNLFVGATGGTIKNLSITATGGSVFALSGAASESLIFRDCIVTGSTSVGSISGFGLIFSSVVQYVGNSNGITYNNITRLLLNNIGWFGNNLGTFEKYTGTFSLIQKLGGFCEVNGTAIGVDVSGDPTITGSAVLESVVFTGATPANYVKKYTTGSYIGFNFNNLWTVNSPGIPREGDAEASGDINLLAVVGSGINTTLPASNGKVKINGTTTSNNLFRFTKDGDNRITYRGNKTRYFQVVGSVSLQGSDASLVVVLYIAKNGNVLTETRILGSGSSGFLTTSGGVLSLPIVGTVSMSTGDYIEIWAERYSGAGNMSTVSLNLTAR